jgi:hypothetical protein
VSLWWRSKQGHDVLHPGRANLGCELVEYFGVITQDDENQVIRCHPNDVETTDSLRDPRLRHQLPLRASQEIGIGCLSEMKVVDVSCGHVSDATARCDRALLRWSLPLHHQAPARAACPLRFPVAPPRSCALAQWPVRGVSVPPRGAGPSLPAEAGGRIGTRTSNRATADVSAGPITYPFTVYCHG